MVRKTKKENSLSSVRWREVDKCLGHGLTPDDFRKNDRRENSSENLLLLSICMTKNWAATMLHVVVDLLRQHRPITR